MYEFQTVDMSRGREINRLPQKKHYKS